MNRADVQRIELKMQLYAMEYIDSIESMRSRIDKLSVRTCYATRGKNMGFRGMYSPSLALKYLIGNAAPGKLLKKEPSKFNGHYFYAFDESDRIIYAKQYPESTEPAWATSEEFIFYHGSDQVSIAFQGAEQFPEYTTLCEYEQGLPNFYALLTLTSTFKSSIFELEQYEYTQRVLSQIYCWHFWENGDKIECMGEVSKISLGENGEATILENIRPLFLSP